VAGPGGRFLGAAHYSSTSRIALRILSDRAETVDAAFFRRRIETAAAHRARVVHDSDAYRLVHAEGDLLPALVIDRYGPYFVIQTLDQGMDAAKGLITGCLTEMFSPAAIVERNDAAVRSLESLPLVKGVLAGELPAEVTVRMNGLRFEIDLLEGQKTGIFLDQRENYIAAASAARGRRALDCFTSCGGFALHLAAAHESVEAVDTSAAALSTARRNAQANGIGNVEFREADVFDLLAGRAAGPRFSTIVLDPPAFSKSRTNLEPALRAYKEINLRALRLLESGGVLITCSCSHHVSESALLETVAAAWLDAGRRLRVLERRTQSLDHPILLTVPETHYLKCLILQVL
jgi:23S rRNA (cytosine1962-C5)-methyltransferase